MPEQTTPPAASDTTGEGTASTSTDTTDTGPAEAPARTVKSFTDCGVDPALAEALAAKGIHSPFPIQEVTLPIATRGHDVIGQARTGTGKTLAFGLALLGRVTPGGGTQALVIVPTRELCIQVAEELQIGRARGLRVIAVYGGVGYEEQEEAFREGHEIVVGTPGRLLDHVNKRNLRLDGVTELVLDEADEMLDMGFLPDVERLIEACNDDRHGMLFSATMPTDVVKLARRYLDHPTFMRADHEVVQTAPNVEQHFFQVHRMDKPRVLARILQSPERGGVYVFVRTKHMADRLVRELEDLATPAIAIHGDLRQATREKNLDKFRDGSATVLVATEVAARGLDVENVTHVINYDCPDDEKMYLHRIGRTARAGGKGVAVTFAEFNEIDRLNVVRKKLDQGENAIAAVFSTSEELTERFDLPADRPWDAHVAAAKAGTRTDRRSNDGDDRGGRDGGRGGRGRGGGGDRGGSTRGGSARGGRDERGGRGGRDEARSGGARDEARSGGARDEAPSARDEAPRGGSGDGRRKGTSDGRPKSKRSSEGRGNDRDARRDRDADVSRDADVTREHAATPGDDVGGSRDGGERGSTRDADGSARTRTRTRTRTRDEARATDDTDRSPGDTPRGATSVSPSTGRTRARARGGAPARTDDATPDDSGEGRRRSGGRDRDGRSGDADRDSGGRSGGSDRDRGGRQRAAQERDGGRGGRNRSNGGRGNGGRDDDGRDGGGRGNRGRGDSGRGSSGRSDGGRGESGRGGRGRGDDRGRGNGRGGRDLDPTVTTAQRGEEARGEGDPQLARRVKVEHLP